MQLTKYTHACVRLTDGDRTLVIDPGAFSEVDEALDGVSTVLITHEHADHVVPEKLLEKAKADADLRVWAPAGVAESLGGLGDRVTAVGAGESFDAGGFPVRTFGGQHAVISPYVPVISNVAFLVGDEGATVYHPGDSFTVPEASVDTLLVPLHAPWSKVSEVIDFTIAVRAPRAYAVHDGLLNDTGAGFYGMQVETFGGKFGTSYERLTPGATVTL